MSNVLYDKEEKDCSNSFNKELTLGIHWYFTFFDICSSYFKQIGSIYSVEPAPTIMLLAGHNLQIIYRSFAELELGYFGISQTILRSALENICYMMYFIEFPESRNQLDTLADPDLGDKMRKLLPKQYRAGWVIEGMLQRIDIEGKMFNKADWYQRIFKNLMVEASKFVHTDFDFIYWQASPIKMNDSVLVNTPKFDKIITENTLWRINETILFNMIALDKEFRDKIKNNHIQLIKQGVVAINKWKNNYKNLAEIKA